jgi:hypothetical protein
MAGVQFLAGKEIFLYPTVARPAVGSTQPPIQWVLRDLFPGVKWLGCETVHSPPSSAKDRNGGAILPFPPRIFMALCLIN